jgi:hypothetical protein
LGTLQLNPRYRFLWLLIIGGWLIIAWSVGKLVWNSEPFTRSVAFAGIAGLGAIASVFALETYRSSNVQDYIHVWERNFENWDGGKPNDVCDLTEQLIDGKAVPAIMRLSINKGPAKFTPVFQSQYDSIAEGARAWLTVWGQGLQFHNDKLGEWRPVLSDTTLAGKFVGEIDCPIHAGKSDLPGQIWSRVNDRLDRSDSGPVQLTPFLLFKLAFLSSLWCFEERSE